MSAAALNDLTRLHELHDAEAQPVFNVVAIDDLGGEDAPPPPTYWWSGYMPAGVVTILGAHGGVGKSTISLMLAVAIACGRPLFGCATHRGRVLYYSAEDPGSTIRHRLHQVLREFGLKASDLGDRLYVLDATGGDPELFREGMGGGAGRRGDTTPTHAALHEYMVGNSIDVLIVDNASDAHGASEIDRQMVRGFMRSLAQMAQPAGAVLLLVHVDKASARGDRPGNSEGYSGSTAWHNSARSRMLLSRGKDDGLILEHQKNNLGPCLPPVELSWPKDGLPGLEIADAAPSSDDNSADEMRALMRWLHEYAERGEHVSLSNSRACAASLMKGDSKLPTVLKAAVKAKRIPDILREAERSKFICRGVHTKANRHRAECWQVTEQGHAFAGIARVASSASTASSELLDAHDAPSAPAAAAAAPSAPSAQGGTGGERAHIAMKKSQRTTREASRAEPMPAVQPISGGTARKIIMPPDLARALNLRSELVEAWPQG